MYSAITSFFSAIAAAANAYAEYLKTERAMKPYEIYIDYIKQCDEIERQIYILRDKGGNANCSRADSLRLRLEQLNARKEYLSALMPDTKSRNDS